MLRLESEHEKPQKKPKEEERPSKVIIAPDYEDPPKEPKSKPSQSPPSPPSPPLPKPKPKS